jgi:hypothetical protein
VYGSYYIEFDSFLCYCFAKLVRFIDLPKVPSI